ncbi:MAG: hypothetical protein DCC71_26045, partial [Proteobacteria bacterium]
APRAALAEPGRLHERGDVRASLRAESLDLAWLAAAAGRSEPEIAGRLDLDVEATGATPLPELTGTLALREVRVSQASGADPIGPVDGRIRFTGRAAQIERLVVPSGDGALRAEGRVAWDARGADTDLRLVADAFALPPGLPAQGALDGALTLAGRWPALALRGELLLAGARVELPERSDPTWSEIRVHGVPELEARESLGGGGVPDFVAPWDVDVALVVRDAAVRGRGAELDVDGRVRVLQEPGAEPTFAGSFEVEDGRYRFQDRVFEIERGVVTLPGTRALDPQLDVVAVRRLRDVTLRVIVSGRASAPRATLESDPPLSESDLLSYLAFERPAASLGANESAQLQSAATQVVGRLVATQVGAALGGGPSVGGLSLQASSGESGPGVGIGGEIAPGVSVHAAQSIGAFEQAVRIEWRFRPSWSVQSEISPKGQSGADVFWSKRF